METVQTANNSINDNQIGNRLKKSNLKQILIWCCIFLFFILFLFTELFYFYPYEIKGNEESASISIFESYFSTRTQSESQLQERGNQLQNQNSSVSLSLNTKAIASIIADIKTKQILYQKNIYQKMPIASIAKLMAAVIILENFNLDDYIKISKEAILADGDAGNFIIGEVISIRSLFYALLIASSNDAVMAIAENIPDRFVYKVYGPIDSNLITQEQRIKTFISLMNKKAQELNLNSTYFADPSGLLEQTQSTAYDLMNLSSYILDRYPIIFEITKIKEMTVSSIDNMFVHKLVNTNKLLENMDNILIGGKTGYLDEAGQCLLVLAKINNRIMLYVILNSSDRFNEMQQLIEESMNNLELN